MPAVTGLGSGLDIEGAGYRINRGGVGAPARIICFQDSKSDGINLWLWPDLLQLSIFTKFSNNPREFRHIRLASATT